MNIRIKIVHAFFLFVFTVIIARLFYWQVLKGSELAKSARNQYKYGFKIDAGRGDILASDGSWLAASGGGWLAYIEPKYIDKPIDEIADSLAYHFVDDQEDKNELLNEAIRLNGLISKDAEWVLLKHRLTEEEKSDLSSLKINGLGFEEEEIRIYPESSTAAHLLGFVGWDEQGSNKGYFGLEGYYDAILSGKSGYVFRETDASGVPMLLEEEKTVTAKEGVDLVTSLNKAIQVMLEDKLKKGIETYGAKGGTAIIMDPESSEILAMSSYPSFDPFEYHNFSNELFRNPAISSSFEPGSIFKVIVMASALDADVVEPDTKCDICAGPYRLDKYMIETWDRKYRPDSVMTDVIVHSDNVGMVFVGEKLGKENMVDYLTKFGIGEKTGIDLQGEATPALREREEWSYVDVATASFGQGVAITPIQMIRAVTAIANDGLINQPFIVKEIVSEQSKIGVARNEGERVISEKTASEITAMMVEAAKNGEAKWTHLRGFEVAGKTGTAQIPIEGHYDKEKTIASFVGFAPASEPRFVMLITLHEPTTSPWASETAAPLWYSVAKDLFAFFGIQPEN